jgi:cell division protein ZapA
MAQVTLRINGYAHALSCADGEEEHLKAMGAELDARVAALRQAGLSGGEARMLVVAALQLADELADARRAQPAAAPTAPDPTPAPATGPSPAIAGLLASLDAMADRLAAEAVPLETAAPSA